LARIVGVRELRRDGEDRAWRRVQQLLGDAARDQPTDHRVPASPDNDDVRVEFGRDIRNPEPVAIVLIAGGLLPKDRSESGKRGPRNAARWPAIVIRRLAAPTGCLCGAVA
jgi:hypothetical protein